MGGTIRIDAAEMDYTTLNRKIRSAAAGGVSEVILDHVLGQRFIADGLRGTVRLIINGVPAVTWGCSCPAPPALSTQRRPCPGEHDGWRSDRDPRVGWRCGGPQHAWGKVLVRDDIGYRAGST